ncbi:hypothetical protein ILUMI_24372 [Ignelater luminosus]|uniref:Uncharacterized protein n=1 Tax=Ignelater luminosus TaxID=2038154 RepID=A0A8K0CAM7_IGNLU|nr:hypothetical protein ILUMI_24372 [Ignelater luminosus]
MYMSLIWNYRHLTACLRPAIVFIWMMVVTLLVCSFYILLLIYHDKYDPDPFLKLRTYGFIAAVSLILIETEKLHYVGEDIQSFLFKYPISKLSVAEAAQVEMLMITLRIQKPMFLASDIFTVDTRLLASVSVTMKEQTA